MLPKTAVLCSTGSRHIHDLSTTLHQHWGLVRFGLRLLVHCSFPPCLSFDFSSSSFFPFLCDLLHHPKATHQSLALLFCSVIFVSRTIDFGLYVPSQTSVLRLSWGSGRSVIPWKWQCFLKVYVCVCHRGNLFDPKQLRSQCCFKLLESKPEWFFWAIYMYVYIWVFQDSFSV